MRTENRNQKTEVSSMLGLTLLALSSLILCPSSFGQGALTPPGPPAPTFKTLEQVEPRTPITNLPYTISQPGSYYLTGNLTLITTNVTGITISTDDVVLDLNGFTLKGPASGVLFGTGHGIQGLGARRNIAIRNGVVRDWEGSGIELFNDSNRSCLIDRILASNNGSHGISSGTGSVVRACAAIDNASSGIRVSDGSVVQGCTASGQGIGIAGRDNCTITECTAMGNVYNILVGVGATIKNCTANGSIGHNGITAGNGSNISDCTARANWQVGIEVAASCRVEGNVCDFNGAGMDINAAGILATGQANRIDSNHLIANFRGIKVNSDRNVITRNTAGFNTIDYVIVASNKVGTIVAAPNSGSISGSTGGAGFGSTDPWANFSY